MDTGSTLKPTFRFTQIVSSSVIILTLLQHPVYSTEGAGDAESGDAGGQIFEPNHSPEAGLTNRDTDIISSDIGGSTSLCSSLPKEYRVDCLAQELKESSRLVRKSGYRNANRELSSASQKLSRLVRQNEDRSAPKIRRNGKTYRAVKKTAVASVNKKAARIIAETNTKLIRSAGNSALKKVHYNRIAKAVNSTKVLLRSA